MTNMRFHIIALSTIICVVLVIFAATGKKEPAPSQTRVNSKGEVVQAPVEEPIGDRFITVWEASWGFNCNEEARRFGGGFGRRQSGMPEPEPQKLVKRNNVLDKIAKTCNKKAECEFTADVETLGNPAQGSRCRPILELVYRCYSYDKPWRVSTNMGETVSMNCKED